MRSGWGVGDVVAGKGSGCGGGAVTVAARVGAVEKVGSSVSLGKGREASLVAGSAVGGTGVVNESPCAPGADSGPSAGFSGSSTVSRGWSLVAFLSASYWWRWWLISISTAPYSNSWRTSLEW